MPLTEPTLYRVVADFSGVAVVTIDLAGLIRYANDQAAALTGQKLIGAPAGSVLQLFDEQTCELVCDYRALRRRQGSESWLLVCPDGSERHVEVSVVISEATGDDEVTLLLSDVTELRELRRRNAFMARHDPVTGTLNRNELEHRISLAQHDPEGAGLNGLLAYVLVRGLNGMIDKHGFLACDAMMTSLGHLLESCLTRTDAVGRISDTEFAVLRISASSIDDLRDALNNFTFTWDRDVIRVSTFVAVLPISKTINAERHLAIGRMACAHLTTDRAFVALTIDDVETIS